MKQGSPASQHLARRLMTLEQHDRESSRSDGLCALAVCEKLRQSLTKLVGVRGFQVLMARALTLAKGEVPWLGSLRVQPNGSLEGFADAAQQQSPEEGNRGGELLLAHLVGLLILFVGETLTLRLLNEIWPDTSLNLTTGDTEEISE